MDINKEELMERLQDLWHYGKSVTVCGRNIRETISEVIKILEQPTADVVEVKHSEWGIIYYDEENEEYVRDCLSCGKPHRDLSPYCPNCGAIMDGGKKE